MKTTVSELVELIDKIDKVRDDLLNIGDSTTDTAADLLWDYRDIIMRTKVEI